MAERVVVAMSGGVDSSVAALLMLEAGHEVVGVTMQLFDHGLDWGSGRRQGCCAPEDARDARRVAERLGIRHYMMRHEAAFEAEVIRPYVEDWIAGRTPSPCVRCNTFVKFDALLRKARALGAVHLVTGHYARIERGPDAQPELHRGRDATKDQSYFLYGVPRAALDPVLFPLGEHTKAEVRALAEAAGLSTAHKAESMECCFVGAEGHAAFVEAAAPRFGLPVPKTGVLRGAEGTALGSHEGVHHFTIGQRKGLGVATGSPLFVTGVDARRGEVRVGPREALRRAGLTAVDCNWLAPTPAPGTRVHAQIRHRDRGRPATLLVAGSRSELRFEEPTEGVAPGQAVVFYDGTRVLGGGWIARSWQEAPALAPREAP